MRIDLAGQNQGGGGEDGKGWGNKPGDQWTSQRAGLPQSPAPEPKCKFSDAELDLKIKGYLKEWLSTKDVKEVQLSIASWGAIEAVHKKFVVHMLNMGIDVKDLDRKNFQELLQVIVGKDIEGSTFRATCSEFLLLLPEIMMDAPKAHSYAAMLIAAGINADPMVAGILKKLTEPAILEVLYGETALKVGLEICNEVKSLQDEARMVTMFKNLGISLTQMLAEPCSLRHSHPDSRKRLNMRLWKDDKRVADLADRVGLTVLVAAVSATAGGDDLFAVATTVPAGCDAAYAPTTARSTLPADPADHSAYPVIDLIGSCDVSFGDRPPSSPNSGAHQVSSPSVVKRLQKMDAATHCTEDGTWTGSFDAIFCHFAVSKFLDDDLSFLTAHLGSQDVYWAHTHHHDGVFVVTFLEQACAHDVQSSSMLDAGRAPNSVDGTGSIASRSGGTAVSRAVLVERCEQWGLELRAFIPFSWFHPFVNAHPGEESSNFCCAVFGRPSCGNYRHVQDLSQSSARARGPLLPLWDLSQSGARAMGPLLPLWVSLGHELDIFNPLSHKHPVSFAISTGYDAADIEAELRNGANDAAVRFSDSLATDPDAVHEWIDRFGTAASADTILSLQTAGPSSRQKCVLAAESARHVDDAVRLLVAMLDAGAHVNETRSSQLGLVDPDCSAVPLEVALGRQCLPCVVDALLAAGATAPCSVRLVRMLLGMPARTIQIATQQGVIRAVCEGTTMSPLMIACSSVLQATADLPRFDHEAKCILEFPGTRMATSLVNEKDGVKIRRALAPLLAREEFPLPDRGDCGAATRVELERDDACRQGDGGKLDIGVITSTRHVRALIDAGQRVEAADCCGSTAWDYVRLSSANHTVKQHVRAMLCASGLTSDANSPARIAQLRMYSLYLPKDNVTALRNKGNQNEWNRLATAVLCARRLSSRPHSGDRNCAGPEMLEGEGRVDLPDVPWELWNTIISSLVDVLLQSPEHKHWYEEQRIINESYMQADDSPSWGDDESMFPPKYSAGYDDYDDVRYTGGYGLGGDSSDHEDSDNDHDHDHECDGYPYENDDDENNYDYGGGETLADRYLSYCLGESEGDFDYF